MNLPSKDLNTLLAPRFLFRFAVPISRRDPSEIRTGLELSEADRLPDLASLDAGTASAESPFADFRMAWTPEGVAVSVKVTGKKQAPWCRESRLEDSDGLQIWIDTRATHNIHRASRFCVRFVFLPSGGGPRAEDPIADQLLINRARENARPVRPRELQIASRVTAKGYHLKAFLPKTVLVGFDPEQYPRLGFHYAVIDRELGIQTFANGREFPAEEDPSCWATLELVD